MNAQHHQPNTASSAPSPAPHGTELLNPQLPYRMKPRLKKSTRDIQLQQFVNDATDGKNTKRRAAFDQVFGDNYTAVRQLAGAIKQHTLDYLDHYLEQFIDQAQQNGASVHFARDAEQANEICLAIAQSNGCKRCVKSKSMVTEEIRLLPALEEAGIETIETDLGEFIIQLDDDAPSHIVTPMIHKDRTQVARAFTRELNAEYTEDPEELTHIAREYLRKKFRAADLGISGANFLIAETGSVVLCTNEGNGGLSTAVPPIHVVLVGIEKVIPKPEHLSVFLKVLARSSTAQPLTVYSTIISGPRQAGEHDGPQQLHIIIVDNGRSEMLQPESRELLRCIRCGACLNACPVYRKAGGGHAYGAVYSGPIGAVITPHFKGLQNYADLPQASSLCGACFEACPVHIDLPAHLIRLRTELVDNKTASFIERSLYRLWASSLKRPTWYRFGNRVQRMVFRALGQTGKATPDPLSDRRWLTKAPPPLSAWTDRRDFPTPPAQDFREWWDSRRSTQEQRESH